MSLGRDLQISLLCALTGLGVACGGDDDDDDGGDAPDAAVDVPDAAPAATHTGQIILLSGRFQNYPELGEGALLETTFQVKADVVPPSYEESPGSPFACKVYEFTPETYEPDGVNEGTLQFSATGGPEYPPCNYVPGQGYRCVGVMGTGGDIQVLDPKNGIFTLTNAAVTFGADEVGRFLVVQGASVPTNNGQFPIVMAMGDNTIAFRNPQPGAAEELGTSANYLTLAGFGPAGSPQGLPDDSTVTFALTAGGDGDLEDFTQTVDVGDSFTLDTASQALISDLPVDGSEFVIGCDGEGGECGTAAASLINIFASDGDTSQLPPFVLPPPQTKAVQIFCVFLAGRATVPPEASAYLQSSGATRMRAVFVRANNMLFTQAKADMQVAAGHAVAGFTDVP